MLDSNRFVDILGKYFECRADPRIQPCPMETGQQPYLDESSGEYQCPLCLRIVGQQSEEDDSQPYGEDIIDEEEAMSLNMNYTPEMVEKRDLGAEGQREVSRKDAMTEMISLLISVDRLFIEYMSTNQEDILTMLTELEEAGVSGFEIGRNLRPKILAVTSHMFKKLPNTKALEVLEVKTNDVLQRKLFLDKTYTTRIDNSVSMAINDVGNTLNIPESMISKAIEEYEKDLPPNREPKDRVKGAAWLYTYLTKKTDITVRKTEFTSLPGISRIPFGKAVSVYLSYFEQ